MRCVRLPVHVQLDAQVGLAGTERHAHRDRGAVAAQLDDSAPSSMRAPPGAQLARMPFVGRIEVPRIERARTVDVEHQAVGERRQVAPVDARPVRRPFRRGARARARTRWRKRTRCRRLDRRRPLPPAPARCRRAARSSARCAQRRARRCVRRARTRANASAYDRADRAARDDVVELVAQHERPGRCAGRRAAARSRCAARARATHHAHSSSASPSARSSAALRDLTSRCVVYVPRCVSR